MGAIMKQHIDKRVPHILGRGIINRIMEMLLVERPSSRTTNVLLATNPNPQESLEHVEPPLPNQLLQDVSGASVVAIVVEIRPGHGEEAQKLRLASRGWTAEQFVGDPCWSRG